MNALQEYTYFYISKNMTSYTFLLVFKIDKIYIYIFYIYIYIYTHMSSIFYTSNDVCIQNDVLGEEKILAP